jgi:ATP-dependent DNA helicase PIF1
VHWISECPKRADAEPIFVQPPRKRHQALPPAASAVIEGECAQPLRQIQDEEDAQEHLDLYQEGAAARETELHAQQKRAFDAALRGGNVFITGGPGTGKSFTLRRIIAALEQKNGLGSALVWAPTGVAAILVCGQTMHSRPGPGVPESSDGFSNMWGSKQHWRAVKTLVLDEVSMADAEFLEWSDAYVREMVVRESRMGAHEGNGWAGGNTSCKPFGGIQLIFCGDFAQLPPVPVSNPSLDSADFLADYQARNNQKDDGTRSTLPVGTRECKGKWAFQTSCWRDACFEVVELEQSFRTKSKLLIKALHELRRGHATHPTVRQLVDATQRQLPELGGIKPTVLYPIKRDVERENDVELIKLDPATEHVYFAEDSVGPDCESLPPPVPNPNIRPTELQKFGENCPAAPKLTLRLGAQVMLLKNETIGPEADRQARRQRLVNGSRGVIVGFRAWRPEDDPAFVSSANVHAVPVSSAAPLAVATNNSLPAGWAAARDPESGRTYYYKIANPSDVRWELPCFADKDAVYPEVRFTNGRTKLIVREGFRQKFFRRGTCTRSQLPLALAWALTIHKGQGQSLDYVIVDLEGCFTDGQAYVAVSRASRIEGLQIRNYSAACVKRSETVDLFYRHLRAGTLDAYLRNGVSLWWHTILNRPEWLRLYRRHPAFEQWERNHPPSTEPPPAVPAAHPPGPPPLP